MDTEPSWTIDDSIQLVTEVKKLGCDFIDVSTGGLTPAQKIPVGPGYQIPFSRAIKEKCDIPTICAGLIQQPLQAESFIRAGAADMVDIGRSMLFDPHWGYRAARRLHAEIPIPHPYRRWVPD